MTSIHCSKGSGTIAPILPSGDYSFQNERILPPDENYSGDRTGYQDRTNVALQVTGPAEYLTSQLKPPLITDNNPTFSAVVRNNISRLDAKYFRATVDNESVICSFNQATNEVYFSSAKPLMNGKHTAILHFANPDGSSRMLYWSFNSNTDPPAIQLVMWNEKEKFALVVFNRDIEPALLHDSSRWKFNAEQNILRNNVGSAGNNMALLPLKDEPFETYTNKTALTVSFTDKNGIVDFIVNRGGSLRKAQNEPCEDCSGIGITMPLAEHKLLEAGAENYAIAYEVANPNNCSILMKWEFWARVPIANQDPAGPPGNEDCSLYDLVIDIECEGVGQTGTGNPYPESFIMEFDNETLDTIAFSRNHEHHLTISFWANCEPGDEYETQIGGDVNIDFSESFDCLHPVFDLQPTVLWGDEAADQVVALMEGIPMRGEPAIGNVYCNTMTSFAFDEMMEELRTDYKCDLFIVAQASDPIAGSRRGNLAPSQIALDMKKNDGTCSYDISWAGGEMLTGVLVLDYLPWGSPDYGQVDDREFITFPEGWPDPNYPLITPGNVWHDWCSEESTIMICNLTEILTAPGGDEISGIKVRITDSTPDPVDGYFGNWRRSANVLDQLCSPMTLLGMGVSLNRSGQSVACEDPQLSVEFVGRNERYDTDPNECSSGKPKKVNFKGQCDERHTSFIYRRQPNGEARIYIAAFLDYGDNAIDKNDLPEELYALVLNYDDSQNPSGWPKHTISTLKRLDEYPDYQNDISWEDLDYLFGGFDWVGNPPDCEKVIKEETCGCQFWIGWITVCDSCVYGEDGNTELNGYMYISSNDDLLSVDEKKDYSVSTAGADIALPNYGTMRGYGETPDFPDKWFGWDDFIQSGGFEAIELNSISYFDEGTQITLTDFQGNGQTAVQSESDLMVIISHSTCVWDMRAGHHDEVSAAPIMKYFEYPDHCKKHSCSDSCPCNLPYGLSDCFVFDGFPQAYDKGYYSYYAQWEKRDETFLDNNAFQQDYCLRNDFKTNAIKENFWQNGNSNDMKWLILTACEMMNNQGSFKPDEPYGRSSTHTGFVHPRERIADLMIAEDGVYFSSASGFKAFAYLGIFTKETETGGGCQFLIDYGDKLNQLAHKYGLNEDCYITRRLWEPSFDLNKTKDPSVAAFMETCAEWSRDAFLRGKNIDSACAIAIQDGSIYSWHIVLNKHKKKPWYFKRLSRLYKDDDYRIEKRGLSDDPPTSKNF